MSASAGLVADVADYVESVPAPPGKSHMLFKSILLDGLVKFQFVGSIFINDMISHKIEPDFGEISCQPCQGLKHEMLTFWAIELCKNNDVRAGWINTQLIT